MTRRDWLTGAAGVAAAAFGGCGARASAPVTPDPAQGFATEQIGGVTVLRQGPEGAPGVLVLHELPGLTPADLALGSKLAAAQFQAFLPVMFGKPGQDNFFRGYFHACVGGDFNCGDRAKRSRVLDRLEPLCNQLASRTGRPIGAIGMCLTGILPLALLPNQVTAAVVCQPTLPFSLIPPRPTGRQRADLGLGDDDLREARASTVPFLTIHYTPDRLCPPERVDAIRATFGTRAAVISLPDDRKHSTLGAHLHPGAFADAITYLKVRLGLLAGPQPMALARIGPRGQEVACGLDARGEWTPAG
jgi:dienelactone hydrolase